MNVANGSPGPWRSERRREQRSPMPAGKAAYAILENGAYADVRLLDLSYGGCSFECPVELTVGDKVKLSVHGRGVIHAEVQRYCDGQAGVLFDSEPAEKEPWPRRGVRERVSAEVSLRRAGKFAHEVNAFDISPYGCKVEFVDRPAIDERVWIKLPGLEAMEGQVCWTEAPHVGIAFAHIIHPAVFDLLLAKLQLLARMKDCD